jgi:hypothetical protein
MATLLIDIDSRNNASKIMEAVRLFKGVRNVVFDEKVHYPHLDKSIKEIEKGQVTRCKSVGELLENLNS